MQIQRYRPRVLRWYHAGPMLFGDWGTSRLYVLGLAFFFTQHAAIWYMAAMCVLLVALGWAYEAICRHFPDGGGVYSAARQQSPLLAAIGSLLLCADYVVTAAISALVAFEYLHVPHPHLWAALAIVVVGILNWFGPVKAGTVALLVALGTVICTFIVAAAAVPYLGNAAITNPDGPPALWWSHFTSIIIAISGVEAIANMTGIMALPVERTARKAIWPVVGEIVLLNMVLTLAVQALPLSVLGGGSPDQAYIAHRDDMLNVLTAYYVGPGFAWAAQFLFAALLLSAVNTAIANLVSIQFAMARDRELPANFTGLNRWGMPVIPLVLAMIISAGTVLFASDVRILAELYAIAVVGVIGINLGACAANRQVASRAIERIGMLGLALLMAAIWLTIAFEKPTALIFVTLFLVVGLMARWFAQHREGVGRWMVSPVDLPIIISPPSMPIVNVHAPVLISNAKVAPHKSRHVLVVSPGSAELIKFAVDRAQQIDAELIVLFVRKIGVETEPPRMEEASHDHQALQTQAEAERIAAGADVPIRLLYATARDVADTILETVLKEGPDVLVLGATRRMGFWKMLMPDVVQSVAERLPDSIQLLIYA